VTGRAFSGDDRLLELEALAQQILPGAGVSGSGQIMDSSFLRLGGNSLAAMAGDGLGVSIEVRALLNDIPLGTILPQALAASPADAARPVTTHTEPDAARQSAMASESSAAQRGMWLREEVFGATPYNVAFVCSIDGQVADQILRQAISEVVQRHDGLRSVFWQNSGKVERRVLPWFLPELDKHSYRGGGEDFGSYVRQPPATASPTSRSAAGTSPRWHVRAEWIRRGNRRCAMAVAGGLDLHRGQLTFDYIDLGTGESWRGRISPADRESLRGWLRWFDGARDVDFAVEGCTGWRYVVEELQRAKVTAHLAEPAETASRRGSKQRAKTDWADARHLRQLVAEGRIPESWIPPAHVLETRAAVRLYKDLPEERNSWQQRVHATLFHQGIPVVPKLGTADGQRRHPVYTGLAQISRDRGCCAGRRSRPSSGCPPATPSASAKTPSSPAAARRHATSPKSPRPASRSPASSTRCATGRPGPWPPVPQPRRQREQARTRAARDRLQVWPPP
jgi:hypothetical protein